MTGRSVRGVSDWQVASLAATLFFVAAPALAADEPAPLAAPAAPPAQAPPSAEDGDAAADEARARYRRGIQLFDEGDYRLALVELERAYALHPSYRVLYNTAQVHYQLGEYAKALAAFERYLKEGGAEIPAPRRTEVEGDLATLRTRVGTLTVRANVEGVELTLNDQPLGRAPLERAVVDAGSLRISAHRPGFSTATRVVKLAGGDTAVVELELVKATSDVVDTNDGLSGVAVGAWIATGALAAGAVGFGIAANGAAKSYEDKLDAPIDGSPAEAAADLERKRGLVSGLAITTDALMVATAVGAGVSLYLTLRGRAAPTTPAVRLGARSATFSVGF